MEANEIMAVVSVAITAFIWYSYLTKKGKHTH